MQALNKAIQSFIFHCRYEKNLSSKTIKAYQTDIEQFKSFISIKGKCSDLVDMRSIDKDMIREYLRHIYVYKPKTIKRKIATLKALFNYFEFEDVIIVNPFRKMKIRIKEGNKLPSTISLSNIKKLFGYLYTKKIQYPNLKYSSQHGNFVLIRDIALLEMLFGTGLRVSELSNIKPENIDLTNGWIKITGKGNKERTIPICDREIKLALKEYTKIRQILNPESEFFFINRHNKRLSEQSVRFMIRKYASDAKLDKHITPHMFRHSVATLLLESGVDIMYIQSLLGHSSINTTQIYIQVNEKAKKKEIDKKHPRRLFSMIEE